MKKILIVLSVMVIGIVTFCAVYFSWHGGGNETNNSNINPPSGVDCENDQDCIDKGFICKGLDDRPTCIEVSLTTGEKYQTPKCVCLNPNKEY